MTEQATQEKIHQALELLLNLDDGEILTGWVIVYETVNDESRSLAGHLYGPDTMTSWRALGLLEWAKKFTIQSGEDVEDAEDEEED